MKTRKILYTLALASSFALAACSDFLEVSPKDSVTGENFYKSEDDFKAATAPLYSKVWFDFNDKFYYGLGDGRGFNLYAPYSDYIYPFTDLLESSLTGPLVSAWGSFYNVIQQSNKVIIGIESSSVDAGKKAPYIGEARFMRGVAYWYLASLWGDAIICTDPSVLVKNPIVNTNPRADVMEFAIRDLEYAAMYMPEKATQEGRLTCYSAYGMLARVYLSMAGLTTEGVYSGTNAVTDFNRGTRNTYYLNLAKKAAQMAIEKGPYELMDNYADLFTIENNNNIESMFALQWVPNGDYGLTNTQQAYFACGSEITGDDAAWGYWTRAQPDVIWEYEKGDTRRKATWMAYGDHYEEISKATGGFVYEKTTQALNVKKGVVGSTKDNSKITRMNSSLNTPMLRLAEVYLSYAEAALGNSASTTDETALAYLNAVRKRAGLEKVDAVTYEALRHERRMELCMEGQYWYDLVRRAYYKQQEVINYITGQKRDVNIPVLWDQDTQTLSLDASRTESKRAAGTADAKIFRLPYPEAEATSNPLLREAPVPYVFTESTIDLFTTN